MIFDRTASDKTIIPQIDGLRGLAILAVIYQHAFSHGIAASARRWRGVSILSYKFIEFPRRTWRNLVRMEVSLKELPRSVLPERS